MADVRQREDWPEAATNEEKAAYTAKHPLDQKRLDGVLQAEIDLAKAARQATDITNRDLDLATSDHLERKLHEALLAEASAGIARTTDSAKFVQTIAAALAALYATALGISFAVATNPLPARGFIAPLFFALAMACTAVYLAFIGNTEGPSRPGLSDSARESNWKRTIYFALYAATAAHTRRNWLRAGVIALFVGVLFMPSPFLKLTNPPSDADVRAQEAIDALPAPPAGNADAELLWYEKVLAAHESAREPTEAELELGQTFSVPFDLGLFVAALVLYGVLLLLAWFFGPEPLSGTKVPVVTANQSASYADP
jgi:lysylphosphatidylglycerol synthetase-like protein (DUF2156 family)